MSVIIQKLSSRNACLAVERGAIFFCHLQSWGYRVREETWLHKFKTFFSFFLVCLKKYQSMIMTSSIWEMMFSDIYGSTRSCQQPQSLQGSSGQKSGLIWAAEDPFPEVSFSRSVVLQLQPDVLIEINTITSQSHVESAGGVKADKSPVHWALLDGAQLPGKSWGQCLGLCTWAGTKVLSLLW